MWRSVDRWIVELGSLEAEDLRTRVREAREHEVAACRAGRMRSGRRWRIRGAYAEDELERRLAEAAAERP